MSEEKKYKKNRDDEYDQTLIDVARVTRVSKGGKKLRFRATLALGDKKGKVGIGVAKGADVSIAISKALLKAKKNMIKVPMTQTGTILHEIYCKYGAAKILLKPAPPGTGIKAGGAVRTILELSGITNVTGKILGTNNKINNVRATLLALSSFKNSKSAKAEEKVEIKVEEPLKN